MWMLAFKPSVCILNPYNNRGQVYSKGLGVKETSFKERELAMERVGQGMNLQD